MDAKSITSFGAWFNDSCCTETEKAGGMPLTVYHGTNEDFSTFETSSFEGGAFFTTNQEAAQDYGDIVIAVHLRILRPIVVSAGDWALGTVIDRSTAISQGYDGYLIKDHDIGGAEGQDTIYSSLGDTWVAFRPEQIKSAHENTGAFNPSDPNFRH